MKNQQIQTEIVKTVEQHVQAGSTAEQQGVYTTHCIPLCYFYIYGIFIGDLVNQNMHEDQIATVVSFYSKLFLLTILVHLL